MTGGADLLARARELVQRATRERRRAEAMGFRFTGMQVVLDHRDSLAICCDFTCICGKAERLVYLIDCYSAEMMPRSMFEALCDPAARLRQQGSFSIPHLLADGYTPAQVEAIIERGHEFDLAERWA